MVITFSFCQVLYRQLPAVFALIDHTVAAGPGNLGMHEILLSVTCKPMAGMQLANDLLQHLLTNRQKRGG